MRVHYLQHVAFEGLGSIAPELERRGHRISCTRLFEGAALPSLQDVDWLIVLGGPMSVGDEKEYPWLVQEKSFIREAIHAGKTILGICLGAQLLADILGARVYRNKYPEIGWFDIRCLPGLEATVLDAVFPQRLKAFHWHGDTFDIPDGALPIAESDACKNQGFIFAGCVVGLQFHLETTPESAGLMVSHCRQDLVPSCYVQAEKEILAESLNFTDINRVMNALLHALEYGRLSSLCAKQKSSAL